MARGTMWFFIGLMLVMDIFFLGLAVGSFLSGEKMFVFGFSVLCIPFSICVGSTFALFYILGNGHPSDPDILKEGREYKILQHVVLVTGGSILIVEDAEAQVWCIKFEGAFSPGGKRLIRKRKPLENERPNFNGASDKWVVEPAG